MNQPITDRQLLERQGQTMAEADAEMRPCSTKSCPNQVRVKSQTVYCGTCKNRQRLAGDPEAR